MIIKQLRIGFWASLVIALAAFAVLCMIDIHLRKETSPLGIVSFELCAYQSSCEAITASWQGVTRSMVAKSLGLDYLFMLAYPAAICFGLLLFVSSLPGALQPITVLMAWGVWVAGAADAVENYHLFQMLIGRAAADHQWPATVAATIKFVFLAPALIGCLIAVTWDRISSRRRSKSDGVKP